MLRNAFDNVATDTPLKAIRALLRPLGQAFNSFGRLRAQVEAGTIDVVTSVTGVTTVSTVTTVTTVASISNIVAGTLTNVNQSAGIWLTYDQAYQSRQAFAGHRSRITTT